MTSIQDNLTAIRSQLVECEKKYVRMPGSVLLLAVSKQQSIENIAQALEMDQTHFGENYLQEALPKIAYFKDKIAWHFIGPIQANKTRKIAEHFQWVHSVADKKIAERLNDQRPDHLPPLNICIQVNIDQEPAKSGVVIEELFPLAEYCRKLPRLNFRGLMAIPEAQKNFSAQKLAFSKLKAQFEKLQEKGFMVDTLSMGMSDDWKAAVSEGATVIRIGAGIFGARI